MAQLQPDIRIDAPAAPKADGEGFNLHFGGFERVNTRTLLEFTGQITLLLRTGTTLIDSLKALREQTTNGRLYDILKELENEISGGSSLARALSEHPKVFDNFFINTVQAGEASGRLADVFDRIGNYLRKRLDLRNQVVTALIYPSIIASVAVVAVTFIIAFVLPKFVRIFEKAEIDLPLPTKILLATSGVITNHWPWLIASVVLFIIAAVFVQRDARTKPIFDALILRLPSIGSLVVMIQTSQLLRTLGTMLQTGAPLVESLNVTSRSCGNRKFRDLVEEVLRRVTQGDPLRSGFEESEFISPSIKTMITTGENSGSLPEVMVSVADYLDEDADRSLKRLSAAIEPAIIVVMGVVVGFIAISILVPLFRLSAAAGGA